LRLSMPHPIMVSASALSLASATGSGTALTLKPMKPPHVESPMSPSETRAAVGVRGAKEHGCLRREAHRGRASCPWSERSRRATSCRTENEPGRARSRRRRCACSPPSSHRSLPADTLRVLSGQPWLGGRTNVGVSRVDEALLVHRVGHRLDQALRYARLPAAHACPQLNPRAARMGIGGRQRGEWGSNGKWVQSVSQV